MTGLWILLAVLLFFGFLLLSYLHLIFEYKEALQITVRFWFVKFKIPSNKQNKRKAPTKEKKSEPQNDKLSDLKKAIKTRGATGLLELLKDVMTLLRKNLRKLRHLKIQRLEVTFRAATEDAAETAKLYGNACSVIYPAISMILSCCAYKKYSVSVIPDFQANKSEAHAYLHVKLRVCYILSMGLGLLLGALRIMKDLKEDSTSVQTEQTILKKAVQ